MRQSSVNIMSRSKKRALVSALDDLSAQMSSLLEVDHPCAQRHIADARRVVEVKMSCYFVEVALWVDWVPGRTGLSIYEWERTNLFFCTFLEI